jgi:hypothetical protein
LLQLFLLLLTCIMFSFFRRSSQKEASDKASAAVGGASNESSKSTDGGKGSDRCNKSHKNDKKSKKLPVIAKTESPDKTKKSPNAIESAAPSKMSGTDCPSPPAADSTPPPIVSPALRSGDHVTADSDDPSTPPPITAEKFSELLRMCRDITSPDRCDPLEIAPAVPSSPDQCPQPAATPWAGSDPLPSDPPPAGNDPAPTLETGAQRPEESAPAGPTPQGNLSENPLAPTAVHVGAKLEESDTSLVASGPLQEDESFSDSNQAMGHPSQNSPTLSDQTAVELLDVTSPTLSPDSTGEVLDELAPDPFAHSPISMISAAEAGESPTLHAPIDSFGPC